MNSNGSARWPWFGCKPQSERAIRLETTKWFPANNANGPAARCRWESTRPRSVNRWHVGGARFEDPSSTHEQMLAKSFPEILRLLSSLKSYWPRVKYNTLAISHGLRFRLLYSAKPSRRRGGRASVTAWARSNLDPAFIGNDELQRVYSEFSTHDWLGKGQVGCRAMRKWMRYMRDAVSYIIIQ
ncbi:hypothetical protein B0T21DRAFT_347417 [Apiosordaria backusii]|uniref:Uncharacterized protein n=1 Tax=Apiosordaria backusii TaxID=314023 RepID=A0AA40BMK6_9PEZI|nr:hypothetical protein B0T21DRAFT_347417 [Apiosordaria backusii]